MPAQVFCPLSKYQVSKSWKNDPGSMTIKGAIKLYNLGILGIKILKRKFNLAT